MKNERGAVLIITFIVMVTLTAITVGFLYMTSMQTKGSGYDISSNKALWIAEGSLQKYFLLLRSGTYNSGNIPDLTENLGDGSYTVTASYDADTDIYTLTSTGTVDVISRQIQQTAAETSAALARAIHADGAHVKLDDSTGGTINGNISSATSVLNEDDLANYQDFVDGTYTITDNGSDPPQDKINPTMDLSLYLALAQADDDPPGSHVATGGGAAGRLTLGAGTHEGVYYASNQINIQDGAIINGSVVCEKSINFDNGPITVTIKPELSTRAQVDGKNYAALICGQGGINSADIGGAGARRGLKDSTINGLVMCTHGGSTIQFEYMENSTFNGTIIATNNIDLEHADTANGRGFVINYNEDIFSPMIEGFGFDETGETTVILQNDWNEIVPAS